MTVLDPRPRTGDPVDHVSSVPRAPTSPRAPLRGVIATRVTSAAREARELSVAVEAPLEIRVAGDTLAITMRTPGHDRELALGFLFAEGVIASIDDVGSVSHCGRTGDPSRENVIDVIPAAGAIVDAARAEASRRGTLTTSACGACGRASIEDLLARAPAARTPRRVSLEEIGRAIGALRASQPVFSSTGGCHGATLLGAAELVRLETFEDVGRHNAIDKLVGARLLAEAREPGAGAPLRGGVLVVSGRSSFDVVQKALVGGAGAIVGLGAPSDLAVEMARRAGLPLYGFARVESVEEYA